MARRPTRNQKREIERITKGLTAGGLKVGPVKFDPVTGELIFSSTRKASGATSAAVTGTISSSRNRPSVKIGIKRPPYTQAFIDQDGTPRFYVRKPGIKRVPLPGLPWSPEFMAAHEAALSGQWQLPKAIKAGTVDAAVIGYLASDAFTKGLSPGTQVERRRILENFRREHGAGRAEIPAEALRLILADKTPAAQRNWVKALRGLVNYCLEHGLMKTDPLASIKLPKMKKPVAFTPGTRTRF